MRGLYFWNKRTVSGLRRSIEYFEQAAIEDPHDALGYTGLADAYVLLDSYGVEPSREAYPSAKAAALKSLQLDELLPEAHASLGMILFFYEWNWPEAERELRRAIDLDPNYAMAHSWYALDLLAMGRSAEALGQAQLAHNLDPLGLIVNTEVGWAYYSNRQYSPAIDAFQNVIDLDQHFARAHTRLGMVYAAEKDFGDAIREFKKAQELSGPDAYVDGLLGYAQALSGNKSAARKLFKDLSERSRHEYVPAFSMALICIGLGDNDSALDWLTKSFQERSTYLVYAKTDPLLDSVRSDPRFGILMNRMGLDGSNRDSDRHS
jgi:tetratricopeptide (TPR) repeat protein